MRELSQRPPRDRSQERRSILLDRVRTHLARPIHIASRLNPGRGSNHTPRGRTLAAAAGSRRSKWITDENVASAIPNPSKITSGKVVPYSDPVDALV